MADVTAALGFQPSANRVTFAVRPKVKMIEPWATKEPRATIGSLVLLPAFSWLCQGACTAAPRTCGAQPGIGKSQEPALLVLHCSHMSAHYPS